MPSVSRSQQRLMAMAYQVKKFQKTGGREGMDPLDIQPEYRREVEDLAASMKMDKLKSYAETSHKDLPERKVKEALSGFLSAAPYPAFYNYSAQASVNYIATNRDKRDPLIKKFMDYIEGKEEEQEKEKEKNLQEAIVAMAPPGTAQPANTPGMGNVAPPSAGNVGSGDKFGDDEEEEGKIGIMSYEKYKKWLKKWQKAKAAES